MTITKFGQSCLLIEEAGVRILLDPGAYSKGHTELTNLDAILITHVHVDHCDIPSIKTLLINNPNVPIITNPQVKDALAAEGIESQVLDDGEATNVKGVAVEGFGADHIQIHSSLPADKNVGFLIANRLFSPGDQYTVPPKPVEILMLPLGGPWCKFGEALDYAIEVKPRLAIPYHDAMHTDPNYGANWAVKVLPKHGIDVKVLEPGVPTEL